MFFPRYDFVRVLEKEEEQLIAIWPTRIFCLLSLRWYAYVCVSIRYRRAVKSLRSKSQLNSDKRKIAMLRILLCVRFRRQRFNMQRADTRTIL